MIINDINQLQELLRSKPGYFENIIEDRFSIKIDEITADNVSWGSTGMDEATFFNFIEMIMDIEKDFDIQIPDDLVDTIENCNFYEFYNNVSIARIRQDKLNKLGI
jgi:acyl carrier protein